VSVPGRELTGVDAAPPPAFEGGVRRGDRALSPYRVGEDLCRVVELCVGDVGVPGHGGEVRVTEVLGDQARVARGFSQPSRRRVAERVRGDVL